MKDLQSGGGRFAPQLRAGCPVLPCQDSSPVLETIGVLLDEVLVLSRLRLPPNSYVEILIHNTSECDCIWRWRSLNSKLK